MISFHFSFIQRYIIFFETVCGSGLIICAFQDSKGHIYKIFVIKWEGIKSDKPEIHWCNRWNTESGDLHSSSDPGSASCVAMAIFKLFECLFPHL